MRTEATLPKRADVPWRNIDGNVIVVRPKEGITYPLNNVATRIWLLSDGTRSVNEIIKTLAEEFEGDAGVIQEEAIQFLKELETASLVTYKER